MMEEIYMLPKYTRKEEVFNMTSHIVGGGLGLVALLACAIVAAYNQNVWGVVSGSIYGFSVILLFSISSLYHGLMLGKAKYIFRILDHCMINVLIAGTYTPILLGEFRVTYPIDAGVMLAILWGLAIFGIAINIINIERFKRISLLCYLGMGWLVLFRINRLIEVLGNSFLFLILLGGVIYSIGVLFYLSGKNKKYMHSVFHVFVNIASILHSVAIIVFIMPN